MRPLHWIGLAQLVIAMSSPFPALALFAVPCWVVLFVQSKRLVPLSPVFRLASNFAVGGIVLYVVMFGLGLVRQYDTGIIYAALLAGLVITGGFLFCSATGVYLRATEAGATTAAQVSNVIRWVVLCLSVVELLTIGAVLLGSGLTGALGRSEGMLLQVCTLGILGATLAFVYVSIRSANEPWTELPGGVRHGP